MRFHIRTLVHQHRARFQMARAFYSMLVATGTIYRTGRVIRKKDGRTAAGPQQTYLVMGVRHLRLSDLGHGWYEVCLDRDSDHMVDLGMHNRLLQLRAFLQPPKADLAPATPMEPVKRGPLSLSPAVQRPLRTFADSTSFPAAPKNDQGQWDRVAAKVKPDGRTGTTRRPDKPKFKKKPQNQRPASAERLAHLEARFGRPQQKKERA